MPKGDKYINLTVYLQNCGLDTITLSFEQVVEIAGSLPPAAWSDSSGHSLSYGWLNAGYRAKGDIREKQVSFYKKAIKDNNTNMFKEFQQAKATLNIQKCVDSIIKFHTLINDGENTRYRSWEHCYKAFKANRHDPNMVEFLCLHLAWYLASWGMLRNSFLLNRDYFVHKPVVIALSDKKFDSLYQYDYTSETIPLVIEAANEIKDGYNCSVTDTLITKILLGIFGCTPAYDRYFKDGARKYKICSGTFNEDSLRSIWEYYCKYQDTLEKVRQTLVVNDLLYPPMKLMDMCLWQIGADEDIANEEI